MSKHKPGRLPTLDVTQAGHSVSTIIIAVTGMVNGNYGDFTVGPERDDYVHVTRCADGTYRARHQGGLYQTDNTLRLAQFIWDKRIGA